MDYSLKRVTPFEQIHQSYENPFGTFKVKKKLSSSKYAVNVSSDKSTPLSSKRTPFSPIDANKDASSIETWHQSTNSISVALQKSMQNPNLTGDFSQICRLPTIIGSHEDLKCIAPKTVMTLLQEKCLNFLLLDCRYPYEYSGGHIKGAENIYLQDDALKKLFPENLCKTCDTMLIFYCEFSSKRAPSMMRFLRNYDRNMNSYPNLFYPELYLMEGGYKAFYQEFKEYCLPPSYKEMLADDCAEEFVLYKRICHGKKSSRPVLTKKLSLNF